MSAHHVNRLIAAALNHADAVRSGQGPSRQAEFLAAVDAYRADRDDFDAARDDFLTRFPTAEDMQRAVNERLAAVDDYANPAVQDDPGVDVTGLGRTGDPNRLGGDGWR